MNKDLETSSSTEWLRTAEIASSGRGGRYDWRSQQGQHQRFLVGHWKEFSHRPGEPRWSSGRMMAGSHCHGDENLKQGDAGMEVVPVLYFRLQSH